MIARWPLVALHLVLTLLVVAALYLLVKYCWYPTFYAELLRAHGIVLATAVAALLTGPLLTLLAYKPKFGKDLLCIVLLQCATLAFGGHLLYAERPIFLVYAVDRFVVITGRAIPHESISLLVLPDYLNQPKPLLVGAHLPKFSSMEQLMSTMEAGGDIEFRPGLYEPLAQQAHLLQGKGLDAAGRFISQAAEDQSSVRAYPLVNPKGDDAIVLLNIDSLSVVDVIQKDPWLELFGKKP